MTWDELFKEYPEGRETMSEEREKQYVNACFACYEQEGFADRLWSPYGDYKKYCGKHFKVVDRCTEEATDIRILPLWNIMFEDGNVIGAYPEEIIPREMMENGCGEEFFL